MEKTAEKKKLFTVRDMAYTAMFTALIAVCAWISVPATIPFTLQTFAVFTAAAMLGRRRGTTAVLLYIILGAAGVPVFANFGAGFGTLLGATGGYIVGFLFTAYIVGLAADKFGTGIWVMALSMVVGLALCYAFGTAWFMYVYAKGTGAIGLGSALSMCVVPYLIPDAVKIAASCILVNRLSKAVKL